MTNIKVGDLVERIDGKTYADKLQNIVTYISNCGKYLRVNGNSYGTYCHLFKVVEPKPVEIPPLLNADFVRVSRLEELGYISQWVESTCSYRYIHPDFDTYPIYNEQGYLLEDTPSPEPSPATIAPVKSDGGSSSYYELEVAGNKIETHQVISDVFGNDFDLGNTFKALVRIQASLNGGGKAGTSIEYDLNKIIYTCNKLKDKYVKTT